MAYIAAPQRPFAAVNINGDPLSSGQVWTYRNNTTTLIASYSDSDGTLNTNPVILNAAGQAEIFLAPGQAYKFKIVDPTGLTPDQILNDIYGAALGGGGDSWFDVRSFGAVGDGVTVDTGALQAALDAATSSTSLATVFTPAGFNCLTGPLTIPRSVQLLGGGFTNQGTTYTTGESAWTLNSGARLIGPTSNTNNLAGFQATGMAFYGRGRDAGHDDGGFLGRGDGAPAYGDMGWQSLPNYRLGFYLCKFANFGRNGIELTDAGFNNEIHSCYFTNCGPTSARGTLSQRRGGIFIRNLTFFRPNLGSTAGANASTGTGIHDCYFGGSSRGIGCDGQSQYDNWGESNLYEFNDVGLECRSSIGLQITGAKFEGNLTNGVETTDVVSFGHFEHSSSGNNDIVASDGYIYGDDGSLTLTNGLNGSFTRMSTEIDATRGLYIRSDIPQITFSGTAYGISDVSGKIRIRAGNSSGNFSMARATAVDAAGNITSATDFFTVASSGKITLNTSTDNIVDVSTSRITNVADPTSTQDAATKTYVDKRNTGDVFANIPAAGSTNRGWVYRATDLQITFISTGAIWEPTYGNTRVVDAGTLAAAMTWDQRLWMMNVSTGATALIAFTLPAVSAVTNAWRYKFQNGAFAITSTTFASSGGTFVNAPSTLTAYQILEVWIDQTVVPGTWHCKVY